MPEAGVVSARQPNLDRLSAARRRLAEAECNPSSPGGAGRGNSGSDHLHKYCPSRQAVDAYDAPEWGAGASSQGNL